MKKLYIISLLVLFSGCGSISVQAVWTPSGGSVKQSQEINAPEKKTNFLGL